MSFISIKKVFLVFMFCMGASAVVDIKQTYKIGGRIEITPKDVDAEYAQIADKNNVTRESVLQQMIHIRSIVLALKLAKQIPDDIKRAEMATYEVDKMIYAQFVQMLNKNIAVTVDDVLRLKQLYSHMDCKKLYTLRELVVNKKYEKNIAIYKNMIEASKSKARDFGSLAKQHSIAIYSAQKGGAIGIYNDGYTNAISQKLENANAGDLFSIDDLENGVVTLYFVEAVTECAQPSEQALVAHLQNEKMNAYTSMLFANYPVDVVAI